MIRKFILCGLLLSLQPAIANPNIAGHYVLYVGKGPVPGALSPTLSNTPLEFQIIGVNLCPSRYSKTGIDEIVTAMRQDVATAETFVVADQSADSVSAEQHQTIMSAVMYAYEHKLTDVKFWVAADMYGPLPGEDMKNVSPHYPGVPDDQYSANNYSSAPRAYRSPPGTNYAPACEGIAGDAFSTPIIWGVSY